MTPELETRIALLSRTPATLRALCTGLPDELIHADEGPGSWSPHAVVAHLIHGERTDWIPRTKQILGAEGDEVPTFEAFDRSGHEEFARELSLQELIDEFGELRAHNLSTLHAFRLRAADLARRARHPALGEVTLGELLATWAVHDLNHVAQIGRVIAHQMDGAVGPWRAYLRILTGESA